MTHLTLASALFTGLLTLPVLAQSTPTCCAAVQGGTILSLSSEARRTVPQDKLRATLAFEATAATPQAAQRAVNAKLAEARKLYQRFSAVKVTTGGYYTYQRNDRPENPRPVDAKGNLNNGPRWVATQDLELDSADSAALLELAGQLQGQGFAMRGLNYYLSRDKAEQIRDELLAEALRDVRGRAQSMARVLELPNVELIRVDTQGGLPPMPYRAQRGMMMAMDKAESMPAPVAEPGEDEVQVSVSAEARLTE